MPVRRLVILFLLLGLCSCSSIPVERQGAPQALTVSRVYPATLQTLRAAILKKFSGKSSTLPAPFGSMQAIELIPPNYPADWISTWTDPSGFLEPYKRLPGNLREQDVLIEEPTGDVYWPSEYSANTGQVKFRCGFILHFTEA